MKKNTREQKPQRTAAPPGHTVLSGVAPDYPVAPESASVLKFPKAKLDQIFTKLHQNLHRPSWHYSKAIPKRSTEKDPGDSRNFRSCEEGNIWARKGKNSRTTCSWQSSGIEMN